jgi:hypothetical protein
MGNNSYTVNSTSTLVIEAVGGGTDTVNASVSYALGAGSEIELLQTTNARGKSAINLTGNDFAQKIVGNAGANVLEGKGGADEYWGGNGNDRFVLSKSAVTNPDGTQVDRIMDYAKGDVVDITQILSVAAGVNVTAGGYLRVTTGGLIQVDLDGGGNNWVTLSTINGSGAVSIRYLSGGSTRDVSVSRTADSTAVLAAAVAASGFVASSATAEVAWSADSSVGGASLAATSHVAAQVHSVEPLGSLAQANPSLLSSELAMSVPVAFGQRMGVGEPESSPAMNVVFGSEPVALLQGTEVYVPAASPAFVTQSVAIPSAEMLEMATDHADAKGTDEVERVLADALIDSAGPRAIDALLDTLAASGPAEDMALAAWQAAQHGALNVAHASFAMDAIAMHLDAASLT